MNARGFTLVELLLSVAIITVLAGLSLPIYFGAQTRNDTASSVQTISAAFLRAETYARGVRDDDTWGVHFASMSATLFRGASYATRVSDYDEVMDMPASITLGFSGDIVFSKLTGTPNAAASIPVTSSNGDTKNVTLSVKGVVDY